MSSSESKQKRKKTPAYTEDALKKALDEIRQNKKSIRQVCLEYGIPKSTVLDRISGRTTDELKKRGPDPVLGKEGEKKVVQWLINISKCGFPVKKKELLDTIQKIIVDGKIKNNFKDNRPGEKWFKKFLQRNKEVSLKNAEGINKARALVTEESIKLWFKGLRDFLNNIGHQDILDNPNRIFNGDETGFALCPKTGKVLGPRGFKNVYQVKPRNEKENITVLLTFNAAGDVCPPCVVFPYVRPPKAVVDSMPPDWCLGKSDSGWMRGDVFFEYVTNEFNNWVKNNNIPKPVLLLVDGPKSHMSLMLSTICEEMKIILYALPPNTTHILQPADVSVFAPLKSYWKSTVRDFLSKRENFNSTVTKTNFCPLLSETITNPNMRQNIISGFQRCGLYPFNENSPDYTKCVRNTLEDLDTIRKQPTNTAITLSEIATTKKVIRKLKPALAQKKIDARIILKELNKLKKTLPTERGNAEISIETETENNESSLINFSKEDNTGQNISINIEDELNVNQEIALCSSSERQHNKGNDWPTTVIETVSAQIHNTPRKESPSQDSLSTLHLMSGSYLDVGSMVSLDDILILPCPDEIISDIQSAENPLPVDEISGIIGTPLAESSGRNILSEVFKNHLVLPEIVDSARKAKLKTPAAISSAAWRKYYEDKERIQNEKKKAIRKRKMERLEKQEKTKRLKENERTRKSRQKRTKTTVNVKQRPNIDISNNDSDENNISDIPATSNKIKCAECDEMLISDVEDDEEKNIGCDECVRWYHLRCTQFTGRAYLDIQNEDFICDLCKK